MPLRLVSAFSVSLYGMFLAVMIPPARADRILAGLIAAALPAATPLSRLSVFSGVSGGTRTILLTVVLAGAAALLFPIPPEKEDAP